MLFTTVDCTHDEVTPVKIQTKVAIYSIYGRPAFCRGKTFRSLTLTQRVASGLTPLSNKAFTLGTLFARAACQMSPMLDGVCIICRPFSTEELGTGGSCAKLRVNTAQQLNNYARG